ncbi:uncharacterized protein LOC106136069 isoform X2 [Amyelois transitella]|uniref:uncharacterized protein LOC106136069 isoform X2 n=1 Tax=Amyelois transitella TaxID=680683 RepID=UPI00067B33B9|nr:uncharacterized protein LOC106136069 isoform X2 [Amyelois transitella]
MKALWICVILQTLQLPIFAEAAFGTPLLTNSKLCQGWNCLNTKLDLPNTLPSKEQYQVVLRSLLPEEWHVKLDAVLDTCFTKWTREYTNTCPGQALMHCVVDNLIDNCPESHYRMNDACTPVSCTAGLKYMFSQSRYTDFEKNLPKERRPAWFLKNYFDTKCCDVQLFNVSVLTECGVAEFMHYYDHTPQQSNVVYFDSYRNNAIASPKPISIHVKLNDPITSSPTKVDSVKIVDPDKLEFSTTTESIDIQSPPTKVDSVKIVDPDILDYSTTTESINIQNVDPLDCCDISQFIQPSWRSECDFGLAWDNQNRLSLRPTASTESSTGNTVDRGPDLNRNDVKIVPLSCESETCVFNKLNILTPTGDVKLDSFTKLLDNFTRAHPEFNKAKARVITECMKKPLLGYDEECQINKVLACTFDVLSEYCPYTDRKHDPCKDPKSNMMCQISSSHIRPKSRRSFCSLPNFVPERVLSECAVVSLSHMKYVTQRASKQHYIVKPRLGCQPMTDSTSCLLNKMGVLNKYKFLDYFKMKDRIRSYTNRSEWFALTDVYVSAFTNKPMYSEHCNSPKQLLNIVDTMLMTCPMSLRKQTPQCNRFFTETKNTPYNSNNTKAKLDQMLNHFHHVFLPVTIYRPITNKPKIQYKPLYNYGLLASGNVPPVKIVDIRKPPKKPLMILPVYMRWYNQGARYPTNASTPFYKSPLLRSGPLGQDLAVPVKPNMI